MNDLGIPAFACAFQRLFFGHPLIARSILAHCGQLGKIFLGNRAELRPFFGGHHKLYRKFLEFDSWGQVRKDLDSLLNMGGQVIALSDKLYPDLLSSIYDPPPALQIIGRLESFLKSPAVGIVGSRKASGHARGIAYEMARDLSAFGVVVVSGLAYGVDAAAHRGAIEGGGQTVAVVGAGLDNEYPRGHQQLKSSIQDSGCVISEFPLGTEPYPANFPQRNRTLSGLCTAVVVVEAAKRSGSLITARFALEQGRDVMAVPGQGGSALSRGSNALIRDGAALVESAEDVINILADRLSISVCGDCSEKRFGHLGNDVDKDTPLLEVLPSGKAISVDDIVALTGFGADIVLGELTTMMISGVIEELPGRYFRKTRRGG